MQAALRILIDVVAYRVKKREMANLAAALSLLLALRLPASQIALRLAFGVLLNVLVYLNNDYCDIELDLASPNRDRNKVVFLADHRRVAVVLQVSLVALLAAISVLAEPSLLVALVSGAGICWAYSAVLKRLAGLDILAMAMWGMAMPLVAVPLTHKAGWLLLLQLGLFSTCFETLQVLRDREADAAQGYRSTAVVLGPKASILLLRFLILVCGLYAGMVLDRFAGWILLLPALLPLQEKRAEKDWNRLRLVFGVGWLAILAGFWLRGSLYGLIAVQHATAP